MVIRLVQQLFSPLALKFGPGTVLAQGSPNACAVQHNRAARFTAEGLKFMIVIEKMDCEW
jgi:hypothetical protein